MRIGVDAYPLARGGCGISNYLFNMLKQLTSIDLRNEYFLYSPSEIETVFIKNSRWHSQLNKGLINRSATLWMQTEAVKDLIRDRIEIFWAPEQIGPINLPKSIKLALNIHDLSWIYYPWTMSLHNSFFHKLFAKRSISRADLILVQSYTTANDLKKNFSQINPDKIKVIYEGVDEDFRQRDKKKAWELISRKFTISKKYILCVGTIEPRKNIESLLRAYALLDKAIRDEYQLLIAGRFGWKNSSLFKLYNKLKLNKNEVRFLGYVPKEDLINLYCGASLFVFPSLYEGFGLPLLEAMACGVPIICSDIEIFREIVNDSAFYVNSADAQLLSSGIGKLLQDDGIRSTLVRRGSLRKNEFSWLNAARGFLSCITAL